MENIWRIYVYTHKNYPKSWDGHQSPSRIRNLTPGGSCELVSSLSATWQKPNSFNCLLKNRGEKKTDHSNWFWDFPQQQNFAMGSLAQISSGAIRCSFNTRFRVRFRRVLVQIPCEVPEGSVRFRRVPVQIPCEVPEGSGADTLWGSGWFWRGRCLVRFWWVQITCEVPEGSGADALWNSKGFRCFFWHKHLIFMAYKRLIFMAKTQKLSSCWG